MGESLDGTESMLVVSLTGSIELHEWAARAYAAGADDDAFILLVRQGVMQSMTAFHRSAPSPRILWNQHDAGDSWTGTAQAPELIWLQGEAAGSGRLPLQPIGAVLERVLGRVGTPRISQGDFLLPLGDINGDPIEFAYDRDWFAFSDPTRSEMIEIELYASTAESATLDSVLDGARTWFGDAVVLEAGDRPVPKPVEFRGSSLVPLVFLGHADCRTREWSIEVLAWLSEVLGRAMRDAGCGAHALVRLRRR